jgi:hypothetical protein
LEKQLDGYQKNVVCITRTLETPKADKGQKNAAETPNADDEKAEVRGGTKKGQGEDSITHG